MKILLRFSPFFLFLLLTITLFRPYFFQGKVPFAGNLLVSFYEPWKSYPDPRYPNGPANKPIGFDSLRIFYPLRYLTTQQMQHGLLPLWNPYDFSGNMHLATYQSAVFHPLTFLFLVLPQIDAWSLVVILQPLLACWFAYLFLTHLGLSKRASTIGSLTFGFSGVIVVLAQESFMAGYSGLILPLILYAASKFFKNHSAKYFLIFVLSVVWSFVSGWFQMTLYVVGLTFFWVIFLYFQAKKRQLASLGMLFVGILLAFFISGIHIIPNLESYAASARGTTDAKFIFDIYLMPISHLITYIAPDFWGNPASYNFFGRGFYYETVLYVGVVGIYFALSQLFLWSYLKSTQKFFLIVWIFTLSLGLALPTSWFILYYLHLPFLSTILPSRIFFLSTFSVAILTAYGAEMYLKQPKSKSFLASIAFLVSALIGLWIFVLYKRHVTPHDYYATISLKNLLLPSITIGALVGAILLGFVFSVNRSKMLFWVFLIITLSSIVYFSNKYLYFSERKFTFPVTPVISELQKIAGVNRIWSYGPGYIDRNFFTYYHLQSPEGYDSFYISRYGELLSAASNNGRITRDIPRADAKLIQVQNLSELQQNIFDIKLLSLLGVKYIAAKGNSNDKTLLDQKEVPFMPVWSDGKYVIYQYTNVLPRAFLVDQINVQKKQQDIIDTIFKKDISSMVILEQYPQLFKPSNVKLQGSARIVAYKPEEVEISTIANKQAILFLSDNYYQGWKAAIDGQTTPLYRADYSFRAIIVPPGQHHVTFVYKPLSLTIGIYATMSGLGLLLVSCMLIAYNNKRKNLS